jgi:outer membrane protein OmpA-like peptidoglycan-associated protein
VNGVEPTPADRVSLGLTIDYGRNVLRGAVEHSFSGTAHVEYGIANRAVVGVSAPMIVMSGEGVDQQGLSYAAVHTKVKLHRVVAVSAQIGVPVSDAPRNGGADPSLWFWPQVIVEQRFGRMRVAANAGFRGHAASSGERVLPEGKLKDGSRVTYGGGASYRIAEPLDLVAETYGTYLLSDSAASLRPSNEAIGGIKVFVEDSSYLVIGAGPRYTAGFEAADLRGVIGFTFEPPMRDADGDGVADPDDKCVHVWGDGPDGCPRDDDEDGYPNVIDRCPYAKGVAPDGCPDRDPEIENEPSDGGIIVGPNEITVFEKILFETGSARILPESNPILDKVANAIIAHPELLLIEVAGHADERGAAQMNVTLTQARVDSVMKALVERKVDAGRLRAKGYGFYCPRDEGHDETAWSKNRRVEFVIVKTTKGPTDAPIGCPNATAHGL